MDCMSRVSKSHQQFSYPKDSGEVTLVPTIADAAPDKDGQFVIAGFNGHGMPVIHLAAKRLVEMIVVGKTFGKTEIPSLYETTKKRLSAKAAV
jgi:hypothetical protein